MGVGRAYRLSSKETSVGGLRGTRVPGIGVAHLALRAEGSLAVQGQASLLQVRFFKPDL